MTISPMLKPCAVALTTASAALLMPVTVFAVERAVARDVIVPVGVRAILGLSKKKALSGRFLRGDGLRVRKEWQCREAGLREELSGDGF